MVRLLTLWRRGGRDLGLLWYALKHPRRPVWLIPSAIVLAVYAIEPLNFALPVLGAVDDLVILPLVLHAMLKFLPDDIRAEFDARA